jgi:outer membrane lipopolysaccharide assembly protein LptE/RlpB
MKRFQLIALITLAFVVTGCGFQLRGTTNLPEAFTQLQLINDGLNDDQFRQLSNMLVKAGATLQSSDGNDSVQLKVKIVSLLERNLVDRANTGKTIVQVSKRLSYSVKKSDDVTPLQIKIIERQINIEQDSNNLLGTGSEKKAAERTLDQALFSQLVFQLKRL